MMHRQYISLYRLSNHKIANSRFSSPEEVISWMGAIQGQDYNGAKWSIGLRSPNITDAIVEQALKDGRILRTWLMRGTLHIVAAQDIRWMLSLVSERIIKSCARRYRELELDTKTLTKSNDILAKLLTMHQTLSRNQLLAELRNQGIVTDGQRAAYMLQRAALDGLIVQGKTIKNDPQYYSLDTFRNVGVKTREENLRELVSRFFKSRGPATLADLGWWSGLTFKEISLGLELCRHELSEEKTGATVYYMDGSTRKAKAPVVNLLPGFDEILLGYKDRSASLDATHSNLWCPGNNGMFMPFIMINGRVKGLWKKSTKKNVLSIESNFFNPEDIPDESLLEQCKERYAKFLNT